MCAFLNLKPSLFRKPALLCFARGATLQFFQLVAPLTQALAKFVGLDPHSNFASDAYEMSLGMLFELVHQDRIQMPALRARDIDGFIFEHSCISPVRVSLSSPSTFDDS